MGDHYHATGVFYFYTQGVTTVGGDLPKPVSFHSGEARWSRPGWVYGPETAGDTFPQFIVLGLPPVITEDPEPVDELVVRDIEPEPIQVTYRNTQYDGDKGKKGKKQMQQVKMHQVRKNLRATVDEDEAAFLQTPIQSEMEAEEAVELRK